MRTVKTNRVVKHNGVNYNIGDPIQMDSEEAQKYVSRGFGVFSKKKEVEKTDNIPNDLMGIDKMTGEIACNLIEAGYKSIQSISEASPKELMKIKKIGRSLAIKFIDSASDLITLEN